jgi:hypothetical protein
VASNDSTYNFSTQEDLPRPVSMAIFMMGALSKLVLSFGLIVTAALALIN